jgi:hypothetical protein
MRWVFYSFVCFGNNIKQVIIFSFFAFLNPGYAQTNSVINLDARDVFVSGILFALADSGKREILLSGYALDRISVKESYENEEDALQDIARRIGARTEVILGVMVIYPPCNPPTAISASHQLKPTPISLSFNRIDPAAIARIISDLHDLNARVLSKEERSLGTAIGIRVKDRKSSDVLALLTATTGIAFTTMSDQSLALYEPDPKSVCPQSISPQLELSALTARAVPLDQASCPNLLKKIPALMRRCEPLELEDFVTLQPRGYIKISGVTSALLESPSGLTYILRKGDYVGRSLGKVVGIDTAGFSVREIKEDRFGEFIFEETRVTYQNERATVNNP